MQNKPLEEENKYSEHFTYIKDAKSQKIKYVFNPDITNQKDYLGKGQFGQVFRGYLYNTETKELEKEVAIKKINFISLTDKQNEEYIEYVRKSINSEIQMKNNFQSKNNKIKMHPNLVVIHNIYLTKSYNVYIVMELCDESLKQYMIARKKKKK